MARKDKTTYLQLKENLDYLKLTQMSLHLDGVLSGDYDHLSIVDTLLRLTNHEVDIKRQNSKDMMIKIAKLPINMTFENFDFDFQPSIQEREIRDLMTLSFIEKKENVVFLGSSGVGKTHLAAAIGLEAAKNRYT